MALPNVLLRRTDLAASAKLVWMALAGHLGPDGSEVWPSVNRLAAMTGLNPRTVLRDIIALEAAGLLAISRETGKPNIYRLLQPQVGLFETDGDQCQKVTSDKKSLVTERHTTSAKMSPDQCQNVTVSTLLTTVRTTPPLSPPRADDARGGESEVFSPSPKEEETETPEEAIAQIETAYRQVFGANHDLPQSWRRKIRRGWTNSDRTWLAEIDVEAIRGGQKMTAGHPWRIFGLGWVQKYLEQTAGTRQAHEVAKAAQQRSSDEAAHQARARESQAAAGDLETAAELAEFRKLDGPTREQFLDAARQKFPLMMRQELIERLAAHMARTSTSSVQPRPVNDGAPAPGEMR